MQQADEMMAVAGAKLGGGYVEDERIRRTEGSEASGVEGFLEYKALEQ